MKKNIDKLKSGEDNDFNIILAFFAGLPVALLDYFIRKFKKSN